jgi:2,4-diaminopentanoate dehydrogenase
MDDRIRVVVLGTGQMGAGIVRLLSTKPGVAVVGVFGRRLRNPPVDAGVAAGLGRPLGFTVGNDLASLLAQTRPAVAIQATCSTVDDAEAEIRTLLANGVHVISIAEEMAFPAWSHPRVAEALDALAREKGVTVVGTGINPGFVLDLLLIALSGVCQRIDAISATRVNDLSPYGPTVLKSQGVGLSPEAFAAGLADGSVVGHLGFPESLAMIATAVGWRLQRVEQTREPIVSTVRRETPFAVVAPGRVAGCLHTATGYVDGRPLIRLRHPQQVNPGLEGVETGDFIDIEGEPPIHLRTQPEIAGGAGTVALAVNLIPRVLRAGPGLKTMADLPVPAATLGDMRSLAGVTERR